MAIFVILLYICFQASRRSIGAPSSTLGRALIRHRRVMLQGVGAMLTPLVRCIQAVDQRAIALQHVSMNGSFVVRWVAWSLSKVLFLISRNPLSQGIIDTYERIFPPPIAGEPCWSSASEGIEAGANIFSNQPLVSVLYFSKTPADDTDTLTKNGWDRMGLHIYTKDVTFQLTSGSEIMTKVRIHIIDASCVLDPEGPAQAVRLLDNPEVLHQAIRAENEAAIAAAVGQGLDQGVAAAWFLQQHPLPNTPPLTQEQMDEIRRTELAQRVSKFKGHLMGHCNVDFIMTEEPGDLDQIKLFSDGMVSNLQAHFTPRSSGDKCSIVHALQHLRIPNDLLQDSEGPIRRVIEKQPECLFGRLLPYDESAQKDPIIPMLTGTKSVQKHVEKMFLNAQAEERARRAVSEEEKERQEGLVSSLGESQVDQALVSRLESVPSQAERSSGFVMPSSEVASYDEALELANSLVGRAIQSALDQEKAYANLETTTPPQSHEQKASPLDSGASLFSSQQRERVRLTICITGEDSVNTSIKAL